MLEEESGITVHNSQIVRMKELVLGGSFDEVVKRIETMGLAAEKKKVFID